MIQHYWQLYKQSRQLAMLSSLPLGFARRELETQLWAQLSPEPRQVFWGEKTAQNCIDNLEYRYPIGTRDTAAQIRLKQQLNSLRELDQALSTIAQGGLNIKAIWTLIRFSSTWFSEGKLLKRIVNFIQTDLKINLGIQIGWNPLTLLNSGIAAAKRVAQYFGKSQRIVSQVADLHDKRPISLSVATPADMAASAFKITKLVSLGGSKDTDEQLQEKFTALDKLMHALNAMAHTHDRSAWLPTNMLDKGQAVLSAANTVELREFVTLANDALQADSFLGNPGKTVHEDLHGILTNLSEHVDRIVQQMSLPEHNPGLSADFIYSSACYNRGLQHASKHYDTSTALSLIGTALLIINAGDHTRFSHYDKTCAQTMVLMQRLNQVIQGDQPMTDLFTPNISTAINDVTLLQKHALVNLNFSTGFKGRVETVVNKCSKIISEQASGPTATLIDIVKKTANFAKATTAIEPAQVTHTDAAVNDWGSMKTTANFFNMITTHIGNVLQSETSTCTTKTAVQSTCTIAENHISRQQNTPSSSEIDSAPASPLIGRGGKQC